MAVPQRPRYPLAARCGLALAVAASAVAGPSALVNGALGDPSFDYTYAAAVPLPWRPLVAGHGFAEPLLRRAAFYGYAVRRTQYPENW